MWMCGSYPPFFPARLLSQYLRGGNQTVSANLCWRRIVPSIQTRLPDETPGEMKGRWDGEGRMEDKKKCTSAGERGRWGWGNRRRKTMRQNQKINEALFQRQDLCTVNITLAIRGESNYFAPFLPLFRAGERRGEKSEGCKNLDRERTREHWCDHFCYCQKLKIKRGSRRRGAECTPKQNERDWRMKLAQREIGIKE